MTDPETLCVSVPTDATCAQALRAFKRALILRRLEQHGTVAAAAKALQLHRSGLYRQMQQLNIPLPRSQ